jgi:hypothetical protein
MPPFNSVTGQLPAGYRGLAIALGALVVAASLGCRSSTGDAGPLGLPASSYALVRYDGQPLPAPLATGGVLADGELQFRSATVARVRLGQESGSSPVLRVNTVGEYTVRRSGAWLLLEAPGAVVPDSAEVRAGGDTLRLRQRRSIGGEIEIHVLTFAR